MIYLLQVSTCWILFYSIYAVFLKKETFFSVNRYYLLGALFTGLVIPLIGQLLPANSASTEVYGAMYAVTLPVVEPMVADQAPLFTWMQAFWLAYGIGAFVVASRMVHGLYRIWHIYQAGERTQKDGYTLVQSTVRHLPFSFFNCIFISKSVRLKGDIEHVLRHEELHVNQWHSLDTLLLEVLHIFFWFNPILIFYKRAIKQSHEYLADAYVTGVHEKYSYGQLLLGQSTSGLEIALANQFFNSQIKKRIKMMYQERSKKQAMVKYFAVVPVLLIALFIFSSHVSKTEDHVHQEIATEVSSYFSEATAFSSTEVIHLFTGLVDRYPDQDELIRSEIHKYSPFLGKEFTVSLNDAKGGCVHSEDASYFDEDGNPISREDVESYDELYEEFRERISALLSTGGDTKASENSAQISKLLETYLSKGLSERLVVNRLQESGIKIRVDGEQVNLQPFEQPVPGKNDQKITVRLVQETITVNGVEAKTLAVVKEQIVKLSKGTDIKIVNFETDGDVIFSKAVGDIAEMCRSLGLHISLGLPIQEDEVAKIAPKNEEGSTEPFRLQLPKDQGVYYEADRMVLTQTEDDDEKDSVLELSGTDSDDKLIIYQLDGKTEDDVVTLIAYGESTDENLSQGDPIIVVNGRMVEKAQYEQLKPEDIASVSVLKGEAAIAKYGEKGKAGVIEVTLKNEHSWISFLDEEPYKVVEHMPRFPGCEDNIGTPKEKEDCGKHEMLKYIYTNIKYPAEARDKGVEGMVVVQFVVNRDGSVTDSKVVRDIGGGTAPEVIRIVDAMPKWIPGRQNGEVVNVLYTLPVRFKLESDEQKETTAEPLQAKDPNYGLGQQTSPLYLLDGKRIDKAEIADTERVITGINVLKGEEAMRKYGDAAKDGAIEITTKTKQAYDREEYTELLALKGPIVYPQPNDGNFRVYFKTESSSPVTINIYGASGNAIKVFDGIIPEQGTVEQQIELGAFTDGPAFMSIIQDGKIYTEKLIFQH